MLDTLTQGLCYSSSQKPSNILIFFVINLPLCNLVLSYVYICIGFLPSNILVVFVIISSTLQPYTELSIICLGSELRREVHKPEWVSKLNSLELDLCCIYPEISGYIFIGLAFRRTLYVFVLLDLPRSIILFV